MRTLTDQEELDVLCIVEEGLDKGVSIEDYNVVDNGPPYAYGQPREMLRVELREGEMLTERLYKLRKLLREAKSRRLYEKV